MKHRFVVFAILALVSFPALCRDSLITWDVTPTGILGNNPNMTLSAWKQLTPDLAIRVYTSDATANNGVFMHWVFKNTGTCQLQPFKFLYSYILDVSGKRVDNSDEVKMYLKPGQVTATDLNDCSKENHCWGTFMEAKKGTLSIKITSPLQCVPQAAPAPAGSTLIN